jgi:NAD(P)-dependent dehydrogenase (short-subunit alcohol dehydrogenase family)
MKYDLNGRVAVVTGSGKGIGRGVAYELARQGVKIVVNYNYNSKTAEETMDTIAALGGTAICVKADVSKPEGAKALVDAAVEAFGGLDIMVTNAALQANYTFDQYDAEGFDLIVRTNLGGYFNCVKAALPEIKKSDCGRIIIMGSVHCEIPAPFDPVYAMSKGAIKAFAREVAMAVGQYGITANVIMPAAVKIEFKTDVREIIKPITERHWRQVPPGRKFHRHPYVMEREGVPEDIAGMVCYLASPAASHVSGACVAVDGGFLLT